MYNLLNVDVNNCTTKAEQYVYPEHLVEALVSCKPSIKSSTKKSSLFLHSNLNVTKQQQPIQKLIPICLLRHKYRYLVVVYIHWVVCRVSLHSGV